MSSAFQWSKEEDPRELVRRMQESGMRVLITPLQVMAMGAGVSPELQSFLQENHKALIGGNATGQSSSQFLLETAIAEMEREFTKRTGIVPGRQSNGLRDTNRGHYEEARRQYEEGLIGLPAVRDAYATYLSSEEDSFSTLYEGRTISRGVVPQVLPTAEALERMERLFQLE